MGKGVVGQWRGHSNLLYRNWLRLAARQTEQ
ncbi:MAG: hypothetical protein FWD09_06355 [Lentimicrobiaceae bacterium]|nr:hypothetical protein [Lentimicrobiaceae bacterium]